MEAEHRSEDEEKSIQTEGGEGDDGEGEVPLPVGPRYAGHCKWFNVLKGYGFIIGDDSTEEIFVHQSQLQMKGFRSLENGARVAYCIRPGKSGTEAYHVTAEHDGEEIQGSSVRPIGKRKNNLIRCFKCGHYGNHTADKCRKITTDEKVCYECKQTGHLVRQCPIRAENQAKYEAAKATAPPQAVNAQ